MRIPAAQWPPGLRLRTAAPRGPLAALPPSPGARRRRGGFATAVSARGGRRSGGTGRGRGGGAMRPQQAPVSGKVFIQRDYSGGTRCQFQSKFPAELENRIDRQQFEETVRTLNNLYAEAEKLGGQSYLEGCLACLTAYTIFLCMETHYEKMIAQRWICCTKVPLPPTLEHHSFLCCQIHSAIYYKD
uniref:Golgin subfamily A member 7 n=1 Tax=Cyanoderma ruficeps TaxID=181631 RepID=A0A8C3XHF1_9PASS